MDHTNKNKLFARLNHHRDHDELYSTSLNEPVTRRSIKRWNRVTASYGSLALITGPSRQRLSLFPKPGRWFHEIMHQQLSSNNTSTRVCRGSATDNTLCVINVRSEPCHMHVCLMRYLRRAATVTLRDSARSDVTRKITSHHSQYRTDQKTIYNGLLSPLSYCSTII